MATRSDSSISEAKGLNIFKTFPKLPLELRDEIWSYHPSPRLIEIVQRNFPTMGSLPTANTMGQLQSSIGSFSAPPTLLSICQESRAVGLGKYKLAFENVLVHPVYIDFSVDVLACFSIPTWTSFVAIAQMTGDDQVEFDRIKNLALPAPTPTYNPRASVNMAIEATMEFPSLKRLFVVEPQMYWAQVTAVPVIPLDQQEIKDLVTLHRQIAFRGVNREEEWEASEVEITPERVLRLIYPED
ncbi:hypothetical protein IFR05_008810 [Cadophora sp. M221]|nr:hypothetical protein IFR05_008810 [Cadophora sp. M221]